MIESIRIIPDFRIFNHLVCTQSIGKSSFSALGNQNYGNIDLWRFHVKVILAFEFHRKLFKLGGNLTY